MWTGWVFRQGEQSAAVQMQAKSWNAVADVRTQKDVVHEARIQPEETGNDDAFRRSGYHQQQADQFSRE